MAAQGLQPRRILDVGTGSGVLAIAAARVFPSATILATDIDPIATGIAAENVRLNGEAQTIATATAVGLRDRRIRAHTPSHLVIANILAGPLMTMAGDFARVTAPGGRLVLSGILDAQARAVTAAMTSAGFYTVKVTLIDGWATIEMSPRS